MPMFMSKSVVWTVGLQRSITRLEQIWFLYFAEILLCMYVGRICRIDTLKAKHPQNKIIIVLF